MKYLFLNIIYILNIHINIKMTFIYECKKRISPGTELSTVATVVMQNYL